MKLIGLTGFAGSGKDTVAEMLLDEYSGYSCAFADPLRRAASEVFGLTHEQMTDREKKEAEVPYWGKTPRQILQLLGTECMRDVFGGDVWVKRADMQLECLKGMDAREEIGSDLVVFTDVRFPEEARFIREHGGVVVNVIRAGIGPVNNHVSDSGLAAELIDFDLLNNAGLEQLRDAARIGAQRWMRECIDMADLKRRVA